MMAVEVGGARVCFGLFKPMALDFDRFGIFSGGNRAHGGDVEARFDLALKVDAPTNPLV